MLGDMSNARELLGKTLRRVREDRNLTQAALAEKADLSVKMIQKIEYGQTSPSPETMDKIAAALDVSVGELYGHGQTQISEDQLKSAIHSAVRSALGPPPADLENARLKARISELESQINLLPETFWTAWRIANEPVRAVFLYLLIGEKEYLDQVPSPVRKMLLGIRRGLLPG